jgi:hypothetical protein
VISTPRSAPAGRVAPMDRFGIATVIPERTKGSAIHHCASLPKARAVDEDQGAVEPLARIGAVGDVQSAAQPLVSQRRAGVPCVRSSAASPVCARAGCIRLPSRLGRRAGRSWREEAVEKQSIMPLADSQQPEVVRAAAWPQTRSAHQDRHAEFQQPIDGPQGP